MISLGLGPVLKHIPTASRVLESYDEVVPSGMNSSNGPPVTAYEPASADTVGAALRVASEPVIAYDVDSASILVVTPSVASAPVIVYDPGVPYRTTVQSTSPPVQS